MPQTTLPIALTALAFLGAAASADAYQSARFRASISGVQTVRWTSTSGVRTDCNGDHTSEGAGTEVLRFDSGSPEKLLVVGGGGSPLATYGTWDPTGLGTPGFVSDTKVTRRGKITNTVTGGWCGEGSSSDTGPYDCGQRKEVANVYLGWKDNRHVDVEPVGLGAVDFDNCPVVTPSELSPATFKEMRGKLSAKLLFGGKDHIVVTGGKTYRLDEEFRHATATTYFRLVLDRVG